MISLKEAYQAHIKKFGFEPTIIGLNNHYDLPKVICRSIIHNIPYNECELLENKNFGAAS